MYSNYVYASLSVYLSVYLSLCLKGRRDGNEWAADKCIRTAGGLSLSCQHQRSGEPNEAKLG